MDSNLKIIGEFDKFVRPPENAVWDKNACMCHGYRKDDFRIMNAGKILEVWPRFKSKVVSYLDSGRHIGMMIAWNGRGSNCTKLFELTEITHKGTLEMPQWVKYFGDPMVAIKEYKRNQFNNTKRKPNVLEGCGLGLVYEIIFGQPLDNAHNSLVDAKAQASIFAHEEVQKDFDRTKCIMLMDDVWSGKKKQDAEVNQEPTRAVPFGWVDKDKTYLSHTPALPVQV